ncbi:hypothetical protein E1B28_003005 [Marasmius oreades]|uniref:F-box domain-containing protein n=1 Tax=Marasmius oreades TaxID=181124 RepID=A0A9P7UMZ5_9AGAR|nr:uncharacterized protein E1B28_003005 [Marasmius oreades]KAG7085444.1 hypothetical protein E1B28_003005 [Marasmius oreades]
MAPRTSSRIQKKHADSNKPTVESDESDAEDVQVQSVRKAKKVKTVAQPASTNANPDIFRRTRGKRGLLERLAKEAPLDILIEIFKRMEPRDILQLARTSKDLRDFLMKRSSAFIWREARENITDLPPLPIDLNEPQYASLLFDNHCHACLRSPCDNVLWEYRVRCHKTCLSKLFLDHYQLCSLHPYLLYFEFSKIVESAPSYRGRLHRSYGTFWLASMFELLLRKYKEIQGDESAMHKWLDEKEQNFRLITRHAFQCRAWNANRRMERYTEQRNIRRERRQEIIKRLTASGWGPKELCHDDFLSHPLLKQSKPVTERMWNNLEPQLFELLQALKDGRLKEERRDSLRSRYELLELAYDEVKYEYGDRLSVYPPMADLILGADLKAIDDIIWNTPQEQELTKSDFVNALREVGVVGFAKKWVEEKNQELEKILQNTGIEAYDLCSVIFSCRYCGQDTWAPVIYMHDCFHDMDYHTPGWNRPEFDPLYELDCGPWRATAFTPKVTLSKRLKKIMALCGNPKPESIESLDRADPLFECLRYRGGRLGKRCFARWMEATLRLNDGDKVVLASGNDQATNQTNHSSVNSQFASTAHLEQETSTSGTLSSHDIELKDAKGNVD